VPPRDISDIVFVVDEDAGPHVAEGIRDAGGNARLLIDIIGRGIPDLTWLPMVSSWGQALITRDVAMRSVRVEREALTRCGVHVFILRGQGMKFDALRETMKRHFPKMLRFVRNQSLPFVAHITANGVDVKETGGRPGARRK
jgi:hypothetical protein